MRNLAIFDIDGTLTESVAVNEVCFVQAFREVLGIERINTNWLDYHFQTDSGLPLEICRSHLGRDPCRIEINRLQSRFVQFLGLAPGNKAGRLVEEGASCVLPDFSDPVRVSECLERVARTLIWREA